MKRYIFSVFLSLVPAGLAWAAEPVRFPVQAYELEGNRQIPTDQILAALKPYVSDSANFDTLRQAADRIEALYAEAGYGAVRVTLPEQEIESGTVKLKIVEARIGQVRVEGNQFFSSENIRASVPMLRTGEPLAVDRVTRSLALANESAAKHTRLSVQRGSEEGEVDAVLKVEDRKLWRVGGSLDNTGLASDGRYRLGLMAQYANLFDRDHALSAQIITSPGHEQQVQIIGLGYRIPLYAQGDSLDLVYGRANTNEGTVSTVGGDYNISGRGEFASVRYNIGLPRINKLEQRVSLGWDWRFFGSHVTGQGSSTSLVPDHSVAPVSLEYSLTSGLDSTTPWRAAITALANTPSGADGTTAAYNKPGARLGASGSFKIWRWQLAGALPLPAKWSLRAEANGQQSHDLLIIGEQFGIGGMESVRGFNEREVISDTGYRATLELAGPPMSLSQINSVGNLLVFYDAGQVRRNSPLPGEQAREGIASAGLGLRLSAAQGMQLRCDLARVLEGGGSKHAGDLTLHVKFSVVY